MRTAPVLLSLLAILAAVPAHADGAPERFAARGACSGSESWTLTGNLPAGYRDEFNAFLGGSGNRALPVRAFSEALALRRVTHHLDVHAFSEYWIARALFEAGMFHIAGQGFDVIASRPVTEQTAGVQLAALECLNRLHEKYSRLMMSPAVAARLDSYLDQAPIDRKSVVWEAVAIDALSELGRDRPSQKRLDRDEALLEGSGSYAALVSAFRKTGDDDFAGAIGEFRKFFADRSAPRFLAHFDDQAHLTLARLYFTRQEFSKASDEMKLVHKSSNELAASLSDLAWAFLMDERYSEAIGTAMNLEAGGLRHTFEPEAPMVMAMALNELCQYPDSVRAINVFRRNYEKPYRWLYGWSQAKSQDLYRLAVGFLQKKSPVPDRVASEWVKSPLFISRQEEINLLFDEKGSSKRLGKSGASQQSTQILAIKKMLKELKGEIREARSELKPDDPLPDRLRDKLHDLKDRLIHLARLRRAAPVWRTMLASHQRRAPGIEKGLVAEINAYLKMRSAQMLSQLEEIAENNQLIEVEIYNGASQDIVWQNAHPDYKKYAGQLSDSTVRAPASAVLNWGHSSASLEENGEVWEDELGSFKAQLIDNCSSKDRYLRLKRRKG